MKNEQIKNQNGKMKYRTRENNRNSALAIKYQQYHHHTVV